MTWKKCCESSRLQSERRRGSQRSRDRSPKSGANCLLRNSSSKSAAARTRRHFVELQPRATTYAHWLAECPITGRLAPHPMVGLMDRAPVAKQPRYRAKTAGAYPAPKPPFGERVWFLLALLLGG